MAVTCSVCGRRIDDGVGYCEGCGSAVPGAVTVTEARAPRTPAVLIAPAAPSRSDHPAAEATVRQPSKRGSASSHGTPTQTSTTSQAPTRAPSSASMRPSDSAAPTDRTQHAPAAPHQTQSSRAAGTDPTASASRVAPTSGQEPRAQGTAQGTTAQGATPAQARTASAATATPQGYWAADPYRRARLRWWDGQRWTEHVHD